ncbi:MAG: ferrous iron transport protein B [Halobacteriovoraceae bacterium]|nr:ferrous iron transport protein B [Halobacteriovoraceae bacterium]
MNTEVIEDQAKSLNAAPSERSKVLLVGFPNAGKSTLFNLLTGGNRKISNYSGITVDSAIGDFSSNQDSGQRRVELVDLPGIYNLNPTSQDEGVTLNSLVNMSSGPEGDLILAVIDWHRLEASLTLVVSLIDLFGPHKVLCVINKDDEKELTIEERLNLEEQLGTKILPISAISTDQSVIDHFIREQLAIKKTLNKDVDPRKKILTISSQALSYVPHLTSYDGHIQIHVAADDNEVTHLINQKHQQVRNILNHVKGPDLQPSQLSEKIDKITLHPLFGLPIFLGIFYFIFHSIYTWAGPVMDLSEELVAKLGEVIGQTLPPGMLHDLLVDGIIGGVGGVVVFLPQIMILFFLLSLLEQSGYISRAAIITDRIMSFFGLGGKAFLPYMSGFACAIPGIMAARTIPDHKERMATILTLPLITCSARLPVYILLIGTFVPDYTVMGIFNSRALSFFFLYFLGSFMALIIAKVLRLSFFKGPTGNFIIDLPHYQRPHFRIALKQSWFKGKTFLKKAGTVILGLSILIWLLSTFPTPSESKLENMTEAQQASYTLEYSALGRMGKTIEPIIKPLGMDWKIGVGLLVSFGARELFVSAMGTIYSLGEVDEESETLREKLKTEVDSEGNLVFDLATAWSILIFFVFSLQCTSTLAILKKETGGWKYPILGFSYMLVLAYVGSFLTFNLLS